MTCTLADIRKYVAVELGGEGVGGFLSSTATAGNVSTLADSAWPANTTLDVAEQWQDGWLLRPTAAAQDKVRIISQYVPNGGVFTPDLSWFNPPVATEPYEIHTVLEPVTAMNRCINSALQQMMCDTELALTPVGGANQHSLATVAPWLINKSWVRQVGWLNSTEDRNVVWPYERVVRGESFEYNGQVVLSHPGQVFGATGQSPNPFVVYVRLMAPAYALCTNNTGVPQSGLILDTDIAPVRLEWAGWKAVVEAWRHYGQALDTAARERMTPNRAEAASMVTSWTRICEKWPKQTFRPLIAGGPLRIGVGGLAIAYRASTA